MTDAFSSNKPIESVPKLNDVSFDLDLVLSSVVSVRAHIPEDAMTASMLGTERAGHGVVIRDDGLVLTIGYLISEADAVWLVDHKGRATTAHVVGYDQETGFGLVQALQRLDLPAIELGNSSDLHEGDHVIAAGHGGRDNAVSSCVISIREFAGYWEYLIDEAIFIAPPHQHWGGTGLFDSSGRLQGIGSLFVQLSIPGRVATDGNMVVPIDLLKPILDDMLAVGRIDKLPRPWLGMLTAETEDKLIVAGLVDDGPAEHADLQVGDMVIAVKGHVVSELGTMYRTIWSLGSAGIEIPLTVLRDGDRMEIQVTSASRYDFLKSPSLQ